MTVFAQRIIENATEIEKRITDFADFRPRYCDILEGYSRLGLRPGSAILLCAPNSAEFLLHWIAILACGCVPCAAPPSLKIAQVNAMQTALDIAAIASPQASARQLNSTRLEKIGSLGVAVIADVAPAYDPFDVLILTTGTSGAQTACVHTVETLAWNATSTNRTLSITDRDRQLIVLPLFHTYGLVTQSLGTILSGGELVIDGPPFNGNHFARLIERERISVCGVTPTIARDLLEREAQLPLLRSLSIGGDRFAPEDVARLLEKPFINELYITYGLTEAGPRISVLPAHLTSPETFDSVGRPFEGIEIRIEDPDPVGVGQLLVKTPAACRRKVGANADSQPFTADGFLRTGDLFKQDQAGYLRYVSRRADIVIRSGEKLNTRSIDQIVEMHPDVGFARTGEGAESELITRVWARDGQELDLGAIHAFLKSRLRRHEVPDRIVQQSREVFHK